MKINSVGFRFFTKMTVGLNKKEGGFRFRIFRTTRQPIPISSVSVCENRQQKIKKTIFGFRFTTLVGDQCNYAYARRSWYEDHIIKRSGKISTWYEPKYWIPEEQKIYKNDTYTPAVRRIAVVVLVREVTRTASSTQRYTDQYENPYLVPGSTFTGR